MLYPVFIHKDKKSDFGVIVPDLPGCYSAGSTMEDAIQNAKEAIECHLEGLLLDNDPIPKIESIDKHLKSPELKDGALALVEVDVSHLAGKSKRVNITLPERVLKQIDEFAKRHGENRSAFLADAAMTYIAEHH